METTLDKIHQLSDNIAAEREDYKECADFIKSSLNLSHHTDLYKLQVSIQTVITYKKIIADLTKQIISFKKLREDTSKSNKDSVDQFPIIKEQLRTNQNNPAFIGYNGLYLSRERKYKENLEHCRKLRDSYTHFLTTEGNQVPEGDIRYHINSLNVLVSPEEIQEANKLLIDSWD
jgi:hypothetical protein